MANQYDPDLAPIVPPPGAPDRIGAPRRQGPAAPPSAVPGAPTIVPADPAAWSVSVPLDHALLVDGERLGSITVRRATGGDVAALLLADDNQATLPNRLRALICGVHPAVLAALAADDAEKVAAACRPFLPSVLVEPDEDPGEASG